MSKKRNTIQVQARLTGTTGQIDGVMEMVIGMFVMTGVVVNISKSKRNPADGQTSIYLDIEMLPPPLGNLGEGDLTEYTGDYP